jgi:hypothetical protein
LTKSFKVTPAILKSSSGEKNIRVLKSTDFRRHTLQSFSDYHRNESGSGISL